MLVELSVMEQRYHAGHGGHLRRTGDRGGWPVWRHWSGRAQLARQIPDRDDDVVGALPSLVFTVRVGKGSASERDENVEFVAFRVGEARPRHVVALVVAAALIER